MEEINYYSICLRPKNECCIVLLYNRSTKHAVIIGCSSGKFHFLLRAIIAEYTVAEFCFIVVCIKQGLFSNDFRIYKMKSTITNGCGDLSTDTANGCDAF